MSKFSPNMILPASKSAEFSQSQPGKRSAKTILLDGIERQIKLFADPQMDGRRWYTAGKTEIAISLRIGNRPLKLVGDEVKVAVPIDHFEDAMNHFSSEIKAGRFDTQLAEADIAMDARREKLSKTRAENKAAKQ